MNEVKKIKSIPLGTLAESRCRGGVALKSESDNCCSLATKDAGDFHKNTYSHRKSF